jgi:hypothetical protein|tara:strand:- start:1093 stop:1317 length:225 start_codon:yes stop_codon:yes gene_type:complete
MLTLREALDEFYSVNSGIFSIPKPETKGTSLLVHHDVGYVFFGVNTSILDEAAGGYWSIAWLRLRLQVIFRICA